MLKPTEIRNAIVGANPQFRRDPDKLLIFLEGGQVACYGANSLSYEYRYTLHVVVTDYPHHADRLILPMLAYLRTAQPELFENHERAQNLIQFEVEFLSQEAIDLSLQVDLTERVMVKEIAPGTLHATHVGEPSHPDLPSEPVTVEAYNPQTGELIGSYQVPAWSPERFTYG